MCVFTAHRGTEVSESFKNACFLRLSEDQRDISIMSMTPEVCYTAGIYIQGKRDTVHLLGMLFLLSNGM